MLYWFVLFYIVCGSCWASDQYVYPVAQQDGIVYAIYQNKQRGLDLYKLTVQTGAFTKEKYSFNQDMLYSYSIGQFQLLPDSAGYSFIDNGRLRVRYIDSYSPISVDFLFPIYDINSLIWLAPDRGIVSARYKEKFGLFHFMIDGRVSPICWSSGADHLYPQVADCQGQQYLVFCVRRMKKNKELAFQILQLKVDQPHIFKHAWNDLTFDEQTNYILQSELKTFDQVEPCTMQSIYDTKCAIGFLCAQNKNELKYLNYTSTPDSMNLHCSWHRLQKKKKAFLNEKLFDFVLPKGLLLDKLVESVRPLLPKRQGDYIYFVDSKGAGNRLGVFKYNLRTDERSTIKWQEDQSFFVPLPLKDKLLFARIA